MPIVPQILDQMSNISKSQKKFMNLLFSTLFSFRGKANFLNLSRYAGCSEKTLRKNYRNPFDFEEFNHLLHLFFQEPAWFEEDDQPGILAADTTFIKKSGKHTWRLDKFVHSTTHRSEKGLEVSLVALIDPKNQALALSAEQTPAGDDESRVDFYLRHLQDSWPYWPPGIKYGVFDGYYSKVKFVDGVCELGLDMIGKLRNDADLRYVYQGEQKARGARRKYDGKVDFIDWSRWEYLGELEENISRVFQEKNFNLV